MATSQQMCFQSGKIINLTAFGGFDKFEILNADSSVHPKGNQVKVQIKACGMNFSDLYVRTGIFTFFNIKPPFVMGSEAAGVVCEIGDEVSNLKAGDRVMCWNFRYGLWAENVVLPESQCFPMPENMTFEEAAAIPVNYVTAYCVVLDYGNLRPGQSILIQSAAGGVGFAATQLARTIENVTIFGTASLAKHEAIKENGVTHCINYHEVDFAEEVKHISPSGVNVILDTLSGNDFVRSQQILKHMGRIIHVGANKLIQGEKAKFTSVLKVWWQLKNVSVVDLSSKNNAVCGLNVATLHEHDPESFRRILGTIVQLFKDGKIKPHIDSVWPFTQVVQATDHMLKRKNIGKIILVPEFKDEQTTH